MAAPAAEASAIGATGASEATDPTLSPGVGPELKGARQRRLREPFRSPSFRRLFAAQTISRWGDTFNGVALVILVFDLTGSGLQVAGTVAFEIIPVLLLGFVAGAYVDRHPRRKVMIAADLARAGVAVGLALFGHNLMVIYAAAFALSAGTVFFNPAAASVLPSVVDPDDLVGANSALWSAAVISQIVLAPLAGALVLFAGAGPAFALNGASFLLSAWLLRRMPLEGPAAPAPRRRLADVAEGLRIIRHSRFLGTLAGVQGLAALSAGATSALLVVLAEDHLRVGAGRFGLLIGAIGVGAGLGPMVLRRFIANPRRPAMLFGPYLLRGGVDLSLAASSNFGVGLVALGVYGVGTSTGMVTYNSLLQLTVPERLRGRIFAFYDVVWQSARLMSIGIGGVLADAIGIRAVYVLGGLLLLAAGALGLASQAPGRPSPGCRRKPGARIHPHSGERSGENPMSNSVRHGNAYGVLMAVPAVILTSCGGGRFVLVAPSHPR